MQGEEGMMVVRAELCARLDALRRFSDRHRGQDFTRTMIGIRQLAAAYGLLPVVRLSEALKRAMELPDSAGKCQNSLYLDRLRDAIGCERNDEQASEAMIASVCIRFS
ncbi:MAG: hypothetical protein M3N39_07940 [Pseudomonadota bacterium]|nr:hypothetical protein [Pseudomonadota bacterium]